MKRTVAYCMVLFHGLLVVHSQATNILLASEAPTTVMDFFTGQSSMMPSSTTEIQSDNVINPFVLFIRADELEAVPDSELVKYLSGHGKSAELHALFLLARKGNQAAVLRLRDIEEKETPSPLEKGILVYAERSGLLSPVGQDPLAAVASIPSKLEQLSRKTCQIPKTMDEELGLKKDVIDQTLVYCPVDALASLTTNQINEYRISQSELARIHATLLLARMGDASAIKDVKVLARQAENGFVRRAAVNVLGLLPPKDDPEIIEVLSQALSDPFTYFVGDVSLGVGAEFALHNYGKMAVWTNGQWILVNFDAKNPD